MKRNSKKIIFFLFVIIILFFILYKINSYEYFNNINIITPDKVSETLDSTINNINISLDDISKNLYDIQ